MLLAGVRSVTDLMVNPGLINLDFADVQVLTFVLNTIPRLCHGCVQTAAPAYKHTPTERFKLYPRLPVVARLQLL